MIYHVHKPKEYFQAAGLDPEQGPTSWDDVLAWGQKLSAPTERYGFVVPAQPFQGMVLWVTLFKAFGGEYFDAQHKPLFDIEAGMKAWSAGLYAMQDPEKSNVVGKYGVISTPNVSLMGGWSYVINAASKNQEAAYLFISWYTSPEISKRLSAGGRIPMRRSVLNDAELEKKSPFLKTTAEATENPVRYSVLRHAQDERRPLNISISPLTSDADVHIAHVVAPCRLKQFSLPGMRA